MKIMKDIGAAVSMPYGCKASGSKLNDAATALTSTFGYSSAILGNYNSSAVITEIGNSNCPVILGGGRKEGKWWIFNVYADGHGYVMEQNKHY